MVQSTAASVLPASFGRALRVPFCPGGFSGEIKGLNQLPEPFFDAFLLASGARILYPVVCFACESGIVNHSKVGQSET